MALFADRIQRIGTENAFKVGPYIKEVEDSTGKKVIRCNLGEPDFPLPKHIREEVKRQIDNDMTHYCDPQGILPLREAVAKYIGRNRGRTTTATKRPAGWTSATGPTTSDGSASRCGGGPAATGRATTCSS